MTLPIDYNSSEMQIKFDALDNRIRKLDQYLSLIPLADAPLSPAEGWVAISDGTGTGFDGASGAGMYRYSGSAWVFVG